MNKVERKKKIIIVCFLVVGIVSILFALKSGITIDLSSQTSGSGEFGIIEKELFEDTPNETNVIRSAEEILNEEYYPRYRLLKEVEGNFSPCGNIKRLYLLNDSRRHVGSSRDMLHLNKLLAYDEKQGKMVEVPFWEEYIDFEPILRKIIPLESKFGPWDGYFYVHDLNQNGVDEIIGFNLKASQIIPEIYEYQDGAFVEVLGYWDYSGQFARIKFPAARQIQIYGYGGELDEMLGYYPWKLYEWSEEERRYVVIEEGVVTELPGW
ncbi:hypothetical protein [Capillibacterium thermochitinicola]|uniref:Uncharacterized protein n=1 Tax=Capillibacterium thermochitinicola TaxID=2699427 RepID=A0A8J6I1V8_9FIRM|nr:hypothetical protein [Capillibacterium thermochitinicola]MBA2134145.1 hypothetical protein [Capillibacterium thermochitinicola]